MSVQITSFVTCDPLEAEVKQTEDNCEAFDHIFETFHVENGAITEQTIAQIIDSFLLGTNTNSNALHIGAIFVDQGSLYVVNGLNSALKINTESNVLGAQVDTYGIKYKIIGFVMLSSPIAQQTAYWIAVNSFHKLKLLNKTKVTMNMTTDGIKTVKKILTDNIKQGKAGMKLNILISKVGKTTIKEIQKQLFTKYSVNKKWRQCQVKQISDIVPEKAIKKILGRGKYPVMTGNERVEVDKLRFTWIAKEDHIRHRELRVEFHVKSTNQTTKRVVGSVKEKQQKARARRINKAMRRLRLSFKPHQLFPEPAPYTSSRMFYESLLEEDEESILAISYCLYYGIFDPSTAEAVYDEYSDLLVSPSAFDQFI